MLGGLRWKTRKDSSIEQWGETLGPPGGKFGTFGGVFAPCTLTILGVIMYLRLGRAGILWAAGIVFASTAITFLTTLSLAAIATNARVRGGGAYYLISRSLGLEFGGAIGVVFYVAQALSVAMYVMGYGIGLVRPDTVLQGWPGIRNASNYSGRRSIRWRSFIANGLSALQR